MMKNRVLKKMVHQCVDFLELDCDLSFILNLDLGVIECSTFCILFMCVYQIMGCYIIYFTCFLVFHFQSLGLSVSILTTLFNCVFGLVFR